MENPSAGEIIAACETLPFASDKRLVVVRELNGTTGRSEAEERFVSYIPKVPDSCVLVIFLRGKADGRKKLYSAVKKKGGIVSFEPLGDAELNGWIVRVFQQNGKKCAPDVASLLSFTVGNDTALLRAEIEKLTALAGDRDTITENDVHAVAAQEIIHLVFVVLIGAETDHAHAHTDQNALDQRIVIQHTTLSSLSFVSFGKVSLCAPSFPCPDGTCCLQRPVRFRCPPWA